MKIQFRIFALIVIVLFLFSCAPSSDDDPAVPVGPDNPITDPVGPVVISDMPFTSIDLAGVNAIAVKPVAMVSQSISSSRMMSVVGEETCDTIESLNGDVTEPIINDGSTPCLSNIEYWEGGDGLFIYGQYYIPEATTDVPTGQLMVVAGDTVKSFLTDSEGYIHDLPGHPIARNSFKNIRVVKAHNGKPHYINSSGKLVWFDFASDTEQTLVDEEITDFSIKPKTNGDHYIVSAADGVKRIRPDGTTDALPELTPGNWHDIEGSVQYATGTKWMRMVIDPDGNITDRVGRSDPEAFQAWIIDGVGISMPTGVLFGGSVNGCTDEAVGDQRIMICNGKAFRVGGVMEDLDDINWCDYGHCGINSWLTIKSCASSNYVYFYGEDTLGRFRLTWIDDLTGESRDILDTHQISVLKCVNDSELAIIGTRYDEDLELFLTEALSITGSDTISPSISVIGDPITDIITP